MNNYIKTYYIAVNNMDNKIYIGKLGALSSPQQNLRCALKIKGKELLKWDIYLQKWDFEQNSNLEPFADFAGRVFTEYLKPNSEYTIINKQDINLTKFSDSLRYLGLVQKEDSLKLVIFNQLTTGDNWEVN